MMNTISSFYEDLKIIELLPLKLLDFVSQASMFSFHPFLSIHARDIGITEKQLGVISLIVPLFTILVPGISGMIADKIGNFKLFLSILLFLNGATALLYLAVPRMENRIIAINNTSVEFHCNLVDSSFFLTENSSFNYRDANSSGDNCNYDCILIREPEVSKKKMTNTNGFCRTEKDCETAVEMDYKLTNKSEVYDEYIHETDVHRHNSTNYFVDLNECADDIYIPIVVNETMVNASCWFPCEEDLDASKHNYIDTNKTEVISNYNIIVVYTIFKIVNSIFVVACISLSTSAEVTVLKEKRADLGYQQLYGKIGTIIFSPIVGALIDNHSTDDNQNFSPTFYVYFALNCLGAVTMLFVDMGFKPSSNAVISETRQLLRNNEIRLLLITGIIIGVTYGFLDTFLFWLMEDLGADKRLMGITVTVGAFSGMIITLFSSKIINKFGAADCISFALAVFVIRLIGYSILTNPLWVFPFEILECFTMTLLNLSVMTHGSVLSDVTTAATMQSISIGAIHVFGKGLGSIIGGFIIDSLGITNAFRIMALICTITCIFYTLINKVVIKKKATSINQNDYNTKEESIKENTVENEMHT